MVAQNDYFDVIIEVLSNTVYMPFQGQFKLI
jgi:hypothetical protein